MSTAQGVETRQNHTHKGFSCVKWPISVQGAPLICHSGAQPCLVVHKGPVSGRCHGDQVFHDAIRMTAGFPQAAGPVMARICCSNCENGAGRFRPMAGIVDARGNLVGNQFSLSSMTKNSMPMTPT